MPRRDSYETQVFTREEIERHQRAANAAREANQHTQEFPEHIREISQVGSVEDFARLLFQYRDLYFPQNSSYFTQENIGEIINYLVSMKEHKLWSDLRNSIDRYFPGNESVKDTAWRLFGSEQ